MKALTFFDYYLADPSQTWKIKMYSLIVSQPFAPETIATIFEGWKIESYPKSLNWSYFNKTQMVCVVGNNQDQSPKQMYFHFDGLVCNEWQAMPQTLNDFISDCTRAGIELQFKQEIVEKLSTRNV